MKFDSIEEILAFAIDRENEAAEFYENVSRDEDFAPAKELFTQFAREERKHREMLEGFTGNPQKIKEYGYEWIPDIKRSDYMVDTKYRQGMPYPDILKIAMKREEKALKLYNDLASKTENEDFIRLFQILAQEEAGHKNYLETLYDDAMAKLGD